MQSRSFEILAHRIRGDLADRWRRNVRHPDCAATARKYPSTLSYRSAVSALLVALGLAIFPTAAWAGWTSLVTTTSDSGVGSLRQALLNANGDATAVVGSPHIIQFSIGSGPQTISPTTALPVVTRPVMLDGTTQPGGATCGASGTPRLLLITLRGKGNALAMSGLVLSGGSSTVQGMAISYFRAGNLVSTGPNGGDRIRCNHIGITAAGTAPDTIASNGVTLSGNPVTVASLDISSPNTIIGGTVRTSGLCDGDCNAIVGEAFNNNQIGILLRFGSVASTNYNGLATTSSATGGTMQGNFIGIAQNGQNVPSAVKTSRLIFLMSTDAAPLVAPNPPQTIPASGGYLIGGLDLAGSRDALASNVISGAKFRDGIDCDAVTGCASGLRIYGNLIGVGPSGDEIDDLAGITYGNPRDGIQLEGLIAADIQSNVISGNGANGVNVASIANNVVIKNNLIGLTLNGSVAGNGWYSTAFVSGNPNFGLGPVSVNTNAASGNGVSIGGFGCAVPNRDCGGLLVEGNVIGNNFRAGVIALNGSGNMTLQNNHVGVSASGVALANGAAGVVIMTDNNVISNNTFAQNGGPGISILRNTNSLVGTVVGAYTPIVAAATNNHVAQNSTYGNAGLAIDLAAIDTTWNGSGTQLLFPYTWTKGVTPNDGAVGPMPPTNAGTFGNRDIDYPIFTSAQISSSAATLTVSGFVGLTGGSAAFANGTVEVFKADNQPADQQGAIFIGDVLSFPHGEGRTYLGSCMVDVAGVFSTCVLPLPATAPLLSWVVGDTITGTTTLCASNPCASVAAPGYTSEFGPNLPADLFGTLSIVKDVTPVGVNMTGSFDYSVACQTPTATYSGSIVVSAGNTGSATATIPAASTNCIITETLGSRPMAPAGYVWGTPTYAQPSAAPLVPGTTITGSIRNPLLSGNLQIIKTVSVALPEALTFAFTLNCVAPVTSPATTALGAGVSTNHTLSMAAGSSNGSSASIGPIATGSTCTVTELAPTAVANYAWGATPAPVTGILIGDGTTSTATFSNTLNAMPGTLSVTKSITPASPIVTGDFPFTVSCQTPLATYVGVITVQANNIGSATISLPAGATNCVVAETESARAAAPPGYSWAAPAYVQPSAAALGAAGSISATIGNALQSGSLRIDKIVSISMPQATTFNFTLTCVPPQTTPATTALGTSVDMNQSISMLTGASTGSSTAIGPIATGSTCTLTENQPASIKDYAWGITPSPNTGIVIGNGTTISTSFTNTLSRLPTIPVLGPLGLLLLTLLLGVCSMTMRRK